MQSIEKKAVIVGAGLVGSLWAIFLAKKGYRIDLFERRGDPRTGAWAGGRSINLAMSHRGWTAIRAAGIEAEIRRHAIAMPGRMIHAPTGATVFQPYGKAGEAIWSVSRGGLNRALLELAEKSENVAVHFDQKCLEIALDEPRIDFENLKSGERTSHLAPLVFGTDGAFSAVRQALQRTDRFDFSQKFLPHGYKELTIPAAEKGAFRMEKHALHIWPRGNFMLIALPNADGSFTCTLFLPFEGAVSFEKLTEKGQPTAFFKTHFPDALEMMPALEDEFFRNPTPSLVTISCRPWQWRGRVCLLGDAAHAIVPFYGQGMNAGFEDCTILSALCDEMQENWAEILPTFSKKRQPDGDAIAELAQRNFVEMRDLVGDPRFLLRKKIAADLHEKFPAEFVPNYSLVTFSDEPYSAALAALERENALFERILALENVEENWQGAAVEAVFRAWLAEKTGPFGPAAW